MPRMPRIVVKDDPVVYHVMSRVALDGYPSGDVEKRRNICTGNSKFLIYTTLRKVKLDVSIF